MFKIIYYLGVLFRNSLLFSTTKNLKKTDFASLEDLQKLQLVRLKELVSNAYQNCSFYKKRMDLTGISPDDIRNLSDIVKLPIIIKDELKKNASEIQIRNGKKLFFSETSGSTGEPLIFYRSRKWDAGHRAAILRGYSWYNVNPWEKNGYFWGFNFGLGSKIKVIFLDFILNRFRLFSYDKKNVGLFAKKLGNAVYLEGYSSMIYETAKLINENGKTSYFNLKMVKGTSEKIYDKYQKEVKKAFGKKMISEYGAAEAGIIAFECPEGNMHMVMENVICEEIDNQLVVTNLLSDSFPIIRYRIGDFIRINKEKKCPCGRSHYIVDEVLGRVGKNIYGKRNKYPSLTLYYVNKNLALNHSLFFNYQAVQREKGLLEYNVEQVLESDELLLLENELKKYYSDDLDIIVNIGVSIKETDKKQKDFVSMLDNEING